MFQKSPENFFGKATESEINETLKETPKEERATREEEKNEERDGGILQGEFMDFRRKIEVKAKEGKMISSKEILDEFKRLDSLAKEERERDELFEAVEDWANAIRYEKALFASLLLNAAYQSFNHRWRRFEKKEKLPEASAKQLWEESFKASQALDKIAGRKTAKALRKAIKEGESPKSACERIFGEAAGRKKRLMKALEDYEAHYKSWRTYIEEEAEKEQIKRKTYEMLEDMYKKGEIDRKGLVSLSAASPAVEKFAALIFGGPYYEKQAARRLLRRIRKEEKKRQKEAQKREKVRR